MISDEFMTKIAGFGIFYRWHPEVAIRYLPVADEINKSGKIESILEVGSGGLGIAPYLKKSVTGADTAFIPPFHPKLQRIKASVVQLPFKDSSFDMVISVDLLEHLSKPDRVKAVYEIVRVAKKKIIIGVPCGKLSQQEDLALAKYYFAKFGKEYSFFNDHIKNGLPEKNEIADMLIEASIKYKKKIKTIIKGNENLSLHNFLMKGWITGNKLIDIFYRKILLFFIPLLRFWDKEPYYRQLFIGEIINENSY